MSNPLISVIVPVYNTEKYIRKCIESILNQTFTDFELILIDDGSTDNSGKICDEYAVKDSRINVIHQKNSGVSVARNIGLDNASGTYVAFVDSDDYIRDIGLEVLLNDIITYNADISCAAPGRRKVSLEESSCRIWQGIEALKKSLTDNGNTRSVCRKLYRRDFVGEIRFEEGRSIHEDGFFVFRCFLKQPTVVLRNIGIYYYTNNPDSASHSAFSEKFFDILYFADRKREMTISQFPELDADVNNMIVKANISMLNILCKADGRKYKKEIKECIRTVKKLKKYFTPLIPIDKTLFFAVKNNLYYIFRFLYKIRYK